MKETSTIILLLFLLVVVLSAVAWMFFTQWLSRDIEVVKEEVIELQARRRAEGLLEEGRMKEDGGK
jgi:hypothetical protein